MDESSGRMEKEENMHEIGETRYLMNICGLISFDGVKIEELLYKINAARNTRSKHDVFSTFRA